MAVAAPHRKFTERARCRSRAARPQGLKNPSWRVTGIETTMRFNSWLVRAEVFGGSNAKQRDAGSDRRGSGPARVGCLRAADREDRLQERRSRVATLC